jgi:hypothetical protein
MVTDDSEERTAYIFKEGECEILYPEDGGNTFPRNSADDILDYVASAHLTT